MKQVSGPLESIQLSERIAGKEATTATMATMPLDRRVDGMIVVVLTDYSLWVHEAASVVTPSATVIAPSVGTGRWHRIAVASAA